MIGESDQDGLGIQVSGNRRRAGERVEDQDDVLGLTKINRSRLARCSDLTPRS